LLGKNCIIHSRVLLAGKDCINVESIIDFYVL
jgi:hypothetical protein